MKLNSAKFCTPAAWTAFISKDMRTRHTAQLCATSRQLRTVVGDQLMTNLPGEATEDADTFREQYLYREDCDRVFQASLPFLALKASF